MLALDATGGVAGGEGLHLGHGHVVEIMFDRVLQARSGHREVDGVLRAVAVRKRVDEAAAEGVAAAHTINDLHVVLGREAGGASVEEHAGPQVAGRGNRGAERDGHFLAAEAGGELTGNGDVAFLVELAAIDVRTFRLDAEDVRRVRLVRDAHVHVGDELRHRRTGLLAGPELAAVVEVAAHGDFVGLAVLERVKTDGGAFAAERGRDASEVEPLRALEDLRPVEILAGGRGDRGTGAVVDDLRGTLGGALLDEIDAETRTAPDDVLRVDAETTHLVARGGAKRVVGEFRDVRGVHAVVGKRHGHVRLAARVGALEFVRLDKPEVALRVQAHHDFTEADDSLRHGCSPRIRARRR